MEIWEPPTHRRGGGRGGPLWTNGSRAPAPPRARSLPQRAVAGSIKIPNSFNYLAVIQINKLSGVFVPSDEDNEFCAPFTGYLELFIRPSNRSGFSTSNSLIFFKSSFHYEDHCQTSLTSIFNWSFPLVFRSGSGCVEKRPCVRNVFFPFFVVYIESYSFRTYSLKKR